MKKSGRLKLRNSICKFLNDEPRLGCKVHVAGIPGAQRLHGKREQFFSRLVSGISKDGRAIALYPILDRKENIPKAVCEYLRDLERLGGIVGTPKSIGEAFCIVIESPQEYPRFKHTYLHNYWLSKTETKDGSPATDAEE